MALLVRYLLSLRHILYLSVSLTVGRETRLVVGMSFEANSEMLDGKYRRTAYKGLCVYSNSFYNSPMTFISVQIAGTGPLA
jgi:hypothetical protein